MPGQFSKSARPLRPGAYFNWVATQQAPPVPPSVGSIVCIPFTSDWGPLKVATLVGSFAEYLAVFGPTIGTPGYNAAWLAFNGEGGFEGRYGAGAVLAYRMGGSSVAKATKVLQNTTPAAAITLTAKYEGSLGNSLRITTQDHAADVTQNELVVLMGTQVLETFVYLDTNIADLVAQINAQSNWITATMTITGVALATVTATAMTGGDDGSTTIASDWVAAEGALEIERFGVLAPYGLTDAPTIAALKAWAGGPSSGTNGRNAKGQRFQVALGGAANESSVTAVTAAGLLADGNILRQGMSSFRVNDLLDVNGNPQVLSSAQFAARIAGVLAGRGEAMSLTGARFPNVDILNGPTDTDVVACINGGVIVLTRDSDPDAPVHIEAARTTFTKGVPGGAAADPAFPYVIYRNPKYMRIMQGIETEWTTWANRTIIGKLPVNSKTRDSAIAEMTNRLKARASVNIVQPQFSVAVDSNPPPSDDDEFIALMVGVKFGRSVEQFYFTVSAG
jgi:hypothetical protein